MPIDTNPMAADMELPRFLTLRQIAMFADVHVRTARRWFDEGRFKAARVGGVGSPLRAKREDIIAMLAGDDVRQPHRGCV